MRRSALLRTAATVVAGGILFNAAAARAEWPTFDAITHFLLTQAQNAITKAVSNVEDRVMNIGNLIGDKITNLGDALGDLLTRGFTQQSNYQKAAVGAQMQIADAQNAAMARVQRDMRNAQIATEHTPSPQQCVAADAGQTAVAASVATMAVAQSIGVVTDNRGEALQGQPAYFGQAQAVQAINALHYARYCSATEEQAGLCARTAMSNADQHAWNLFGSGNLATQEGINAANDFATNLVQPVVPAALRGDQLASVGGQDAAVRRRSYNARMSLSRNVLNYMIAVQAPTVALTQQQRDQLRNQGLPDTERGSWMQALRLEVERRFSDTAWAASLQRMPPATVEREIAAQLALSNYLALQNYRVGMYQAAIGATQVAQSEETNFRPTAPVPTPNIAQN